MLVFGLFCAVASAAGPTITNFLVTPGLTTTTVSWTTSATGTSYVFYGTSTIANGLPTSTFSQSTSSQENATSVSFTLTGLTSSSLYELYGESTSTGGNTTTSQRLAFTNQNLVGYWTLGEGTGTTAYDRSGNGYDDTVGASTTWITNGMIGGALNFPGSGNIGSVNATSVYNNLAAGTISAWIDWNGNPSTNVFLSADTGNCQSPFWATINGTTHAFTVRVSNTPGCTASTTQFLGVTPPVPNLLNNWHMLTYVVSSTGNTFYIDGSPVPTSSMSYTVGSPTSSYFFASAATTSEHYALGGVYSAGSNTFGGGVDDVRIYNTPLSAAQVLALYNYQTAVPVVQAFSASPSSTTSGSTSTLTWSVAGATSVSITPGTFMSTSTATNGSTTVNPTSTTVYTLTASNGFGTSTATTSVTIATGSVPTINLLSIPTTTLGFGSSTSISWNVSNASSLTFTGNALNFTTSTASGTMTFTPTIPGSLEYDLLATNGNGTSTASTTATITNPGTFSVNCTRTPTAAPCSMININGDASSSGGFSGYADATIRQDPLTGALWMAYSWPHTTTSSTHVIDTHLASSSDGGVTWNYAGALYTSQLDPASTTAGYMSHEVMNLYPQVVSGVTYWYGIHSVYDVPPGGAPGTSEPYTHRWELVYASSTGSVGPMALVSTTDIEYLGDQGNTQTGTWPIAQNLSSLVSGSCGDTYEPSLTIASGSLYLFLSCTNSGGPSQYFYAVFKAPNPTSTAPNWSWSYVGSFAVSSDAKSIVNYLGATNDPYITQMDVTPSNVPGKLFAIATDAFNATSGKNGMGCVAMELANIDPPQLVYNSQGQVQVDAALTSSDSTSTGPGSCTYSPYSGTGMIIADRHTLANGSLSSVFDQSYVFPAIGGQSSTSITISNFGVTPGNTTATASWATSATGTSYVFYGTSTVVGGNISSAFNLSTSGLENATSVSFTLTGLASNTLYDAYAESTSTGGQSAYSSADLYFTSPNLIGYWPFDVGTGTTEFDQSGNGYDDSVGATTTWLTNGMIGGALQFTRGQSAGTGLPVPGAYNGVSQGTISAWINWQGTTSTNIFFAADTGNCQSPFWLGLNGTAQEFSVRISNTPGCTPSTTQFQALTPPIPNLANNWHMLTYVVSSTGNTFYVDGSPIASSSMSYTVGSPTSTAFFSTAATTSEQYVIGGVPNTPGFTFGGAVDDVRIYNAPLSAAQVLALYNYQTGAPTISSFSASPASITSGSPSTLSWITSGATGMTITAPGFTTFSSSSEATQGSLTVNPTSTTVYTFTATNNLGSATTTATVTVTSSSPITAPINVTSTSFTSSSIFLSWSVSTDTATSVLGYYVYRNTTSTPIASTSVAADPYYDGNTYFDDSTSSPLSASTTYTYYVSAFDGLGNVSLLSAPFSASTAATGTIPNNYQALNASLQASLATASNSLAWNGQTSTTLYGWDSSATDDNGGLCNIRQQIGGTVPYQAMDQEIASRKAMGDTVFSTSLGYPMLDPNFYVYMGTSTGAICPGASISSTTAINNVLTYYERCNGRCEQRYEIGDRVEPAFDVERIERQPAICQHFCL